MYEDITYDVLLARMLEKALSVNSKLDTREGSLVWLGQAPAAVELQNLYIALDTILNETFADTASREYLILRAAERGLSPQAASAAVLQLSITPTTLSLDLDTRFSIGDLNYYVSKDLGGGDYEITCETMGESGNDYGATVIPIEYVEGLETCTITALLVPGEDEEDTEVFRERYFSNLNSQAFGGNKADYLAEINAISGVGGVKVYRAWNSDIIPADLVPPDGTADWISGLSGVSDEIINWLNSIYSAASNNKLTVGGTVKVVIIDSTFSVPSAALIELVQTIVDPIQNAGEGVGIAPIGHVVNVAGVQAETINLAFTISYQQNWDWEDVESSVTDTINSYFLELKQGWEDTDGGLIIRISQLESRLLDVDGVLDVVNTKINSVATNYTLQEDYIPVLGTITPTTASS